MQPQSQGLVCPLLMQECLSIRCLWFHYSPEGQSGCCVSGMFKKAEVVETRLEGLWDMLEHLLRVMERR